MLYIVTALAGALGAILRYAIGALIPSTSTWDFPVSTLTINLLGSLILSCFFTHISTKSDFPAWIKTAVSTGFIGSFTTFSTFNVEFIQLFIQHAFFTALLYLLISISGGYIVVRIGYRLGKGK